MKLWSFRRPQKDGTAGAVVSKTCSIGKVPAYCMCQSHLERSRGLLVGSDFCEDLPLLRLLAV